MSFVHLEADNLAQYHSLHYTTTTTFIPILLSFSAPPPVKTRICKKEKQKQKQMYLGYLDMIVLFPAVTLYGLR